MPWKEVSPMSERSRFATDCLSTEWSMAELWDVYFGPLRPGRSSERDMAIEDALGKKRRRKASTRSSD